MLSLFLIAAPFCAVVATTSPEIDEATGLGAFRGEFSDQAPSPFVPIGTVGLEPSEWLVPVETLTRASSLIESWGEGRIEIALDIPLSGEPGAALEVAAMLDAWSLRVVSEPRAAEEGAGFFVSAAGASSAGLERAVMGFVNNERAGRVDRAVHIPAPGIPGGLAAALCALLSLRRRRA